nr:C1-like protein [Tanacetum cinerariifolium]
MEEINHFFHQEHPLKLIDWEKQGGVVVECDMCEESISVGDSAYACVECRFFLHKSCSQLQQTIHYTSLFHRPLNLIALGKTNSKLYFCYVCGHKITKGFFYGVPQDGTGEFNACSNCFLVEFAHKAESDAIKKEASIKLIHEGHPQHSLTLMLRPASLRCDACKTEEKGLFYECDRCDFWIHKSCASLAPIFNLPHLHPKHPLVLVYSLPENFYKYPYYCQFCRKYIRRDEWLYHCRRCRYFAHIKCTINAQKLPYTPRDDPSTSAASDNINSLLHFPMAEGFIDPLKVLHSKIIAQDDKEATEINYWNHLPHSLILNYVEDPQGNNMMPDINSGDPIKVCYACVRPLSFPYYSCKEDGCLMFAPVHKYCAELPQTIQHQLHPDHTLHLADTWEDANFYTCNGCFSLGNTFAYKCETKCKFYFCVNCAFLPKTIKHESHNHPLTQLIDPGVACKACNQSSAGISYSCNACAFQLCMYCAMRSPQSVAHRYCKGHEITLTYPPVEDHPEDFYCDICEEEMDPNFPLYHCHDQKYRSSFHLYCLSRIDYLLNV